jgi:ferric-dicitrate binding protein FerR (iron transport regulator)
MKDLSDNTLKNFLAGECSEKELAEINTFIHESEENARRLFCMEELYRLGKNDASVTPERIDRAEKRLFKRIEQEEAQRSRRITIGKWRKYAAMTLLVLFAGGGLGYWLRSADSCGDMIVESATGSAVKEILLPDGTKVWLNNGATIRYAGKPGGKERNVYIDGEAYLEVVKDSQKPFIVQSDVMQVRVLGTTFNFKNDKTHKIAETTLIEGEIEIKGNNNEGMIVLTPGQRAELNKSTGRLTVRQVNARLDAVWRNDLIPFEQADLFTIIQTLERFYHVKIILSPNVRTDVTYSGVLKKKNTIESVLDLLKNAIPINYKIAGKNIFISSEE